MEEGMSQPMLRAFLIWSALAAAVPIGILADPGTITKYVFPDGRAVYSDKPVPGARAEKEIVVAPGPRPQTRGPSQGSAAPAGDLRVTEQPPTSAQSQADLDQAVSHMLKAASGFASARTAGWNENMVLYVLWRVGSAEITRDCFWGREGQCLSKDMTDKQMVLTLFTSYRKGEASDDGLQQWLKEDPSAVPYGHYFVGKVLENNIRSTYVEAEKILREGKTSTDHHASPPDLVVSYIAATARRLREHDGLTVEGWRLDDFLGWLVLYHPGMGTTKYPNVAALFADTPIPYRETSDH
jgi:hypothetical protein